MTSTLSNRRISLALALSASLVIGTVTAAAAQPTAPESVAAARAALSKATSSRVAAESRLTKLTQRQASLEARLHSSTSDAEAVTTQMTDARRTARQRAVDAYVNGGAAEQLAAVLQSGGPSDASARTMILASGAEAAADAADQFEVLRQENDPGLATLATSLDEINRQLEAATSDVAQTSAFEADAERALVVALDKAKAVAIPSKPVTTTTVLPVRAPVAKKAAAAPSTTAPDDKWAALRNCESGGDYTVVSGSGRYRGAYQFDQSTWESVGGVGDPAAAEPAEQDKRAQLLYEARGARAWPHCGVNLP